MIDIDPLGVGTSLLFDVNDRGQAVGRAEFESSDDVRAILWQDGELTDLGALPDYPQSGAAAINERGQIVGYVANFDAARAVLWARGRIIDLDAARLVLMYGHGHQRSRRMSSAPAPELLPHRRRPVGGPAR